MIIGIINNFTPPLLLPIQTWGGRISTNYLHVVCENLKRFYVAYICHTIYLWSQNTHFHSVWATISTLYSLGTTQVDVYYFYNFFFSNKNARKNGIDWFRAACISRRIVSVLGKVAAVHTRVVWHPGAGALRHRRRSIPPTDAATEAIASRIAYYFLPTLRITVGGRYVRRNTIRRREYNILLCVFACILILCVRIMMCVRLCLCVRVSYAQIDLAARGMRSVQWKHTRRAHTYIIIICIVETKKS